MELVGESLSKMLDISFSLVSVKLYRTVPYRTVTVPYCYCTVLYCTDLSMMLDMSSSLVSARPNSVNS